MLKPLLATLALAALPAFAQTTAPATIENRNSKIENPPAPAAPHLLNLAAKPAQPRFKLPLDRVWPAQPGQADVCLWEGDRFAAMSITIDDNWAPDHAFWLDAGEKTGFKFTWFVITDNIKERSFGGTWDDWKKIRAAGHDVQSHTVAHLSGKFDLEAEYRDSIAPIEKNLPGNKVTTLAYPGGSKTMTNDPKVAARYYLAARSTYGTPNKANQTHYLDTSSISGKIDRTFTDSVLFGTSSVSWLGNKAFLRGWLCVHFHGVSNPAGKTDEEKKANYPKVLEELQYLKSKEADLWFATFREVCLYGQERDTAKLKVTSATDSAIALTLTDDMDDTRFDYPLTVKVRLPDAWTAVQATQDGKPIDAKLITHEGGKFALIKPVPDRGPIQVTPK